MPSSPVDLSEELIDGNNGVILTWRPPNTPNGVISGYQIVYSGHERSQVRFYPLIEQLIRFHINCFTRVASLMDRL